MSSKRGRPLTLVVRIFLLVIALGIERRLTPVPIDRSRSVIGSTPDRSTKVGVLGTGAGAGSASLAGWVGVLGEAREAREGSLAIEAPASLVGAARHEVAGLGEHLDEREAGRRRRS